MLWQVTKASAQRDGQRSGVNSDSVRRVAVLTHMGRSAAIAAATRLVEGLNAAGIVSALPANDIAALDPDAVQFSGDESTDDIAASGRPAWKALRVSGEDDAASVVGLAHTFLDAGAERILLDAAGGPHPGGTGIRVATELAAAVAREVPILLAGGLDPANVGAALAGVAALGVDSASGTERPAVAGQRRTKDPLRVALFVKRAHAARLDRPNLAVRPTPVPAGLLVADDAGRWGVEREFGGRYVPETLMAALEQLETAYFAIRHDPVFWSELRELLVRHEDARMYPSQLRFQHHRTRNERCK